MIVNTVAKRRAKEKMRERTKTEENQPAPRRAMQQQSRSRIVRRIAPGSLTFTIL